MPTAAPQHPPPPQMPGWQLSNQDAQGLKEEVATILERENLRFPGAQPVSFSREHVEELQRQEYFMCEKTDGLRCLLFLHFEDRGDAGFEPVTFLIDRKNNYYNLQPAFRIPYYKAVENYEAFLYGTILDGELVNDQYPGEPTPRLNFYVFDCLAVDNENVTQKTLEKRLGRLQEYVLKPYHNMLSRIYGPNIKPDDLKPFALKSKKVYPAYSLHEMFNNVLPTLKHGNDGLIFTAKNTRYEFGTDRHILKWKPPHENTIDFKLRLGDFPTFDPQDGSDEGPIPDYDAMPTSFALLVQHNANNYQHFASLAITPSEWETLKSLNQRLDGRIIECYRTPSGDWKYKADFDGTPRWRDDKKDANHISTVNSVLASIERPVTQADLLGVEERIKKEVYRLQGREGAYRPPPAGLEGEREREAKKRKFSDGVNGH